MKAITKKQTRFLVAVGLNFTIIILLALFHGLILFQGTDVSLKIQPVDPRDPIRGDYVEYQFDISQLDPILFSETVDYGEGVYVPLVKEGEYWIAGSGISTEQPENGLFLRAVVKSVPYVHGVPEEEYLERDLMFVQNNIITVRYGLEEYFVPEGAGRGVAFTGHETSATVSVNDRGLAVLKQIYLDGEPWP